MTLILEGFRLQHYSKRLEELFAANEIPVPTEHRSKNDMPPDEYIAAKKSDMDQTLTCIKLLAAGLLSKGKLSSEIADPREYDCTYVQDLAHFLGLCLKKQAHKIKRLPETRRRLDHVLEGSGCVDVDRADVERIWAAKTEYTNAEPTQSLLTLASSLRGKCPGIVLSTFSAAYQLDLQSQVAAVLASELWPTLGYATTVTMETIVEKVLTDAFNECLDIFDSS